jgi:hypothetical protein
LTTWLDLTLFELTGMRRARLPLTNEVLKQEKARAKAEQPHSDGADVADANIDIDQRHKGADLAAVRVSQRAPALRLAKLPSIRVPITGCMRPASVSLPS